MLYVVLTAGSSPFYYLIVQSVLTRRVFRSLGTWLSVRELFESHRYTYWPDRSGSYRIYRPNLLRLANKCPHGEPDSCKHSMVPFLNIFWCWHEFTDESFTQIIAHFVRRLIWIVNCFCGCIRCLFVVFNRNGFNFVSLFANYWLRFSQSFVSHVLGLNSIRLTTGLWRQLLRLWRSLRWLRRWLWTGLWCNWLWNRLFWIRRKYFGNPFKISLDTKSKISFWKTSTTPVPFTLYLK